MFSHRRSDLTKTTKEVFKKGLEKFTYFMIDEERNSRPRWSNLKLEQTKTAAVEKPKKKEEKNPSFKTGDIKL